jgi:hypothetical protein
MKSTGRPSDLLAYIDSLLAQMADLAARHDAASDVPFSETVGPHLRHIIEHYEALTGQIEASRGAAAVVVDYDSRARDQRVQSEPAFALARITLLRSAVATLAAWPEAWFHRPVEVHTLGGSQGEFAFAAQSTWLRELGFLASHTVHHFAVLKTHASHQGRNLGDQFGKAPATVAHETARA